LRKHLLIAYRLFFIHKFHSLINLAGLSIGIAAAILVVLYVGYENSYDKMHPAWARTYRIGLGFRQGTQTSMLYLAPGYLAEELRNNLPEVEEALLVKWVAYPSSISTTDAQVTILTDDIRWVETNVTKVFAFTIIAGNSNDPLPFSNSIIISQTAANSLFGSDNPIGKAILVNDRTATQGEDLELVVTAVYRDLPANSTFRHNYLCNINSLRRFQAPGSGFLESDLLQLYVVLADGAKREQMYDFIAHTLELKTKHDKEAGGIEYTQFPVVRRIDELHFDQSIAWDFKGGAVDKQYLWIFGGVAILIVVVSCINYINLTTARATERAKEICIKKSFGASRTELIKQFLLESLLFSVLSTMVGLVIVIVVFSHFNELSARAFRLGDLVTPDAALLIVCLCVFVTVVGGGYPTMVLSGLSPLQLLTGKLSKGKGADTLRKTMVAGQFIVSQVLLIFTLGAIQQLSILKESKLNEHGDQLMAIRWMDSTPLPKYASLKTELLRDPNISYVTIGNHLPRLDHFANIHRVYKIPDLTRMDLYWNQFNVDFDFPKCFELEFIAGRDFDPSGVGDSSSFVVNEACAPDSSTGDPRSLSDIASTRNQKVFLAKSLALFGTFPIDLPGRLSNRSLCCPDQDGREVSFM
jgi:putative ABC transport system permease protein